MRRDPFGSRPSDRRGMGVRHAPRARLVGLNADRPRPSRRSDDGQAISCPLYCWTGNAALSRHFRYRPENLNLWLYPYHAMMCSADNDSPARPKTIIAATDRPRSVPMSPLEARQSKIRCAAQEASCCRSGRLSNMTVDWRGWVALLVSSPRRPRSHGRRSAAARWPRRRPHAPRPPPSLAPGAGYLPGGGVEPVEHVGRGDRQQQCGEFILVVVPGGLVPDFVRHRVRAVG